MPDESAAWRPPDARDIPDEQSLARFDLAFNRLAVGPEQQDGAVVDNDLDLALVVLDAKLVVLNGAVVRPVTR